MSTVTLIAGNCGGGKGGEDRGFESLHQFSGRDLFSSELLGSSFTRPTQIWSKNYYRNKNKKKFHIIAKIKKGKKYDYPWPDDMDDVSSEHLSYLSHFKPLTEKPKPVTLPFEKPLVDLEKKITEIRRMAEETGLDFSNQIGQLENKYQQALKDLYKHLTPIQRLSIARHPNRPTVLDHILNMTEKWVELHGDRAGYDDPAIVTGLGSIEGKTYMLIGHQKGRNTKENIFRNFAMPTPHGYRKALRMMKYADHHKFPIITFVDTPGAFADLKSEELGQGEAIAYNLRAMFGLKVPIVTVVTGEGGSGGALAIGCANKMFMLENSAFYVASPEACAAILWKSSQAAPKAAEKLRITAQEHYRLKIADGIIPEPIGGAHVDPAWTSQQIKNTIVESVKELEKLSIEELLEHRRLKFRYIGGFQEGIPAEPNRKRNMKPSEINLPKAADIESEIEILKKKILEAKGPSDPVTSQAIEKLMQDVDKEITNAFIIMGLKDKLEAVQLELSTASENTPSQPLNHSLKEKVDKLTQEFNCNLSQPGAYLGLKQKLEKLNLVNKIIETEEKKKKLKAEINQKIPAALKTKMEHLKRVEEKMSQGEEVDKDLIDEVEGVKRELVEILKAAKLEVVKVAKKNVINATPELKEKIEKVNKEIYEEIERVTKTGGISKEIEELKEDIAKSASTEDIQKAEAKLKQEILATLDVESLKEKVENLAMALDLPKDGDTEHGVAAANGRF